MRMAAAGTCETLVRFTRIYGVMPQKSIGILSLEVGSFDVKDNEIRIHEEKGLFCTQLPFHGLQFVSVRYVIGGM